MSKETPSSWIAPHIDDQLKALREQRGRLSGADFVKDAILEQQIKDLERMKMGAPPLDRSRII